MAPSSPSKTRAGPSKRSTSMPGHLDHRPLRGQRAAQDGDAPAGVDRRGERRARPRRRARAGRGRPRFSAIVRPVTVRQSPCEQAGVEQLAHHDRDAADAVEVGHVEPAVGLGVGDVGHPPADAVEVVELEARPGPRGRWPAGAARRWSSRRAPSTTAMAFSNAALVMIWRGRMPQLEQAHDGPARLVGDVVAAAVDGRRRRRARQRHARAPRPTDAMVLAVNIPAQLPSVGQAWRSIAASSSSVIVPAARAPDRLEDADDVERLAVATWPGRIDPP